MVLPDWAQRKEQYNPGKDRDYFISRSLLHILSILRTLRNQGRKGSSPLGVVPVLCTVWLFTLLIVTARSSAFLWAVLAGVLLLLCLQPTRQLGRIVGAAIGAAIFCILLVLPALFLGNGAHVFLLPFKTFLTVSILMLLQVNFSWHALTGALRSFHVPALLIFILDTTLRYISILGEEASETLTALKLRSVGYNPHKKEAIGGIAGIMLQKSQRLSQDMYEAMCCRCFTGDYEIYKEEKKSHGTWFHILWGLMILCYLFLYFRLEW